MGTEALRADCWIAAAAKRPSSGSPLEQKLSDCESIPSEHDRGECAFVLAETTLRPDLCTLAGPFADDCALHVVSWKFAASKVLSEDAAATDIVASGLAFDDPRPWSAYFRELLGRAQPLDRSTCAAVTSPARAEACRRTGLALHEDRMNQARDQRAFTCVDGIPTGPWPDQVAWAPDPELAEALAARTDLCTPLDRPAPRPAGRGP